MRRAWTTYCFGKSWNAAALNLHGPSGCLNGMQTCRCRCHDSRLENVRIRWAESMANEIPKEKPQHYNVTTAFHCTSSKLTVHADRIGGHPSLLWPFWRQHGIANLFTSIFAWVLPSHFLIPSSHPISHIPYPMISYEHEQLQISKWHGNSGIFFSFHFLNPQRKISKKNFMSHWGANVGRYQPKYGILSTSSRHRYGTFNGLSTLGW